MRFAIGEKRGEARETHPLLSSVELEADSFKRISSNEQSLEIKACLVDLCPGFVHLGFDLGLAALARHGGDAVALIHARAGGFDDEVVGAGLSFDLFVAQRFDDRGGNAGLVELENLNALLVVVPHREGIERSTFRRFDGGAFFSSPLPDVGRCGLRGKAERDASPFGLAGPDLPAGEAVVPEEGDPKLVTLAHSAGVQVVAAARRRLASLEGLFDGGR